MHKFFFIYHFVPLKKILCKIRPLKRSCNLSKATATLHLVFVLKPEKLRSDGGLFCSLQLTKKKKKNLKFVYGCKTEFIPTDFFFLYVS